MISKILSVIFVCIALFYDLLPIDMIPDVVPLLGIFDDSGISFFALLNLILQFPGKNYKYKILKISKILFFLTMVFSALVLGSVASFIALLIQGFDNFTFSTPLYCFVFALAIVVFFVYRIQSKAIGYLGELYSAGNIRTITKGFVFSDIYVPSDYGVQQIDIIAVTQKGILVIEKKTRIGLVVGNKFDKEWKCYTNKGKRKYTFKNPLHQNFGHVEALAKNYPKFKDKLINVILFSDNTTLGNNIPNNVITDKKFKTFYNSLDDCITATEKKEFKDCIQQLNLSKDILKKQHKQKISKIKKTKFN